MLDVLARSLRARSCSARSRRVATFVLFYLMTVFTLSWGTSALGFARQEFLVLQMVGVLFFAVDDPALGRCSRDRAAARAMLIAATRRDHRVRPRARAAVRARGALPVRRVPVRSGFALMGFTYGPLGTALAELFPTAVRYTGASLAFNLAGIFGASLAPYIATWLAANYGLAAVGYYLSAAALSRSRHLLAIHSRAPSARRRGDAAHRRDGLIDAPAVAATSTPSSALESASRATRERRVRLSVAELHDAVSSSL